MVAGKRGRHDADAAETVLQQFYEGTTIFVTGATGFMGKVLLEKLLRSLPKISRIYLLVRPKKGRSVQERLQDITSSPCFSELMQRQPELKSKLVVVEGDTSLDALGLSDADRRVLGESVNIVFHMAAIIRFDVELKIIINQNVRSVREMMLLCRTFTQLKSVVSVSTAWSHCPLKRIEERLYDPPIPCGEAIELAENTCLDVLNKMTPSIIGEWPNTYNFSKALAEDAVKCYGKSLRVGVFRPSIVSSCIYEPMLGWTDNLYGSMGISMGIGLGVIRVADTDTSVRYNAVPCDMTINCLIACAWDVAENKATSEIPVYNCVLPEENCPSYGCSYNTLLECSLERPLARALWYSGVVFARNKLLLNVYYAVLHYLPALLLDAYLVLTSKRPVMFEMMRKVHRSQAVYSYFNGRNWVFDVDNVQNMWKKLHVNDQKMFDFDMNSIDHVIYVKNAWIGVRRYLAKDPDDTIPAAKVRSRRLYWLHRATQCALTGVLVYLSWVTLSLLPLGN